jgi:hypothetical protein
VGHSENKRNTNLKKRSNCHREPGKIKKRQRAIKRGETIYSKGGRKKSMRIYHPPAQILHRLIDLGFKLENSARS